MFIKLEGETAIVVAGGVFRVVDLYELDGKLFASLGSGYVRLYATGATSKDKLMIDRLTLDTPLYVDRHGRLCVSSAPERTKLTAGGVEKLRLPKE
jgi:hypothetical protein